MKHVWMNVFTALLALGVAATLGCASSGSKSSRAGDEVIVDEYLDIPGEEFEEISAAPSEDHVWVSGYWERDPGDWTWIKGHWDKPPHQKAHWMKGHWKWHEDRWHWTRGHWAAGSVEPVVVDEFLPVPSHKVEIITKEPSKEHVWIPGSWERDPDQWTWVKGHWEKPPHKTAHWRAGHWNWQEGRWHWARGHWVNADVGWIVDEMIDIPSLLAEKRPSKPSDKNHWVAGYWEWDGKWIWIPGYWTSLPDPKASWVAGHWDRYGAGGWRWIAGHWRVS